MQVLAGTPANGGQDRAARALQDVIPGSIDVVNIPGRGGGNAWEALLRSSGQGEVVAVSSPTLITNKLLDVSPIDDRDLTPLAILYTEYTLAVTRAGSELLDPQTLRERLGSGRMEVAFATAIGNVNHLVLAALCGQEGISLETTSLSVHDSARGAMADLVSGSADMALVSVASAGPEMTAGTASAAFVSAPNRLQGRLAQVPTLGELGVDCSLGMWRGLVGPPGMEDEAVARWDSRLKTATGASAWQDLLVLNSWTDTYAGSSATRAFLDGERAVLESLLVSAGVTHG